MSAEKQACGECRAEYFVSEPACPGCGAVNPRVRRAGRRARGVAAGRRWFVRLLVLGIVGALGWLGWTVVRSQPRRAVAELAKAAAAADAASFAGWVDPTAVARRLSTEDPGLAERLAGPPAEDREPRLTAAVEQAVRLGIARGEARAWGAGRATIARRGREYPVTVGVETVVLARDAAGAWRVIAVPWTWLEP